MSVCSYLLLTVRQANGGKVSISEDQVDIKIVDHLKKEARPGTYVV